MITWVLRICGITFALVTFQGAWMGYRKDAAFADHGVRAEIQPVTSYEQTVTTTTKVGITVGQSTRNATFVSFKTAAGQPMRVYMDLPDSVLARITAGLPVTVEYLPEDPMIARFGDRSSGYAYSALMGVIVLGLTVFFWRRM